jgi:4-amino-4-deoxy-L-arabinose transferase-like glycosyltransferase
VDADLQPAGSRSRWACVAILAAAAVLFVFVRAPLLSIPLERDEGEYAYIAQRILAGDVPYRDAFDQKPPGVFLVYVCVFALLGESIEAIHLFMYAWTAATALALFGCVRLLAGPLAAAFAVLVFATLSGDPVLTANAANTEMFLLLPMVASVYCMLRALAAGAQLRWWILCGALAAAACWFKQVAATNALYVAVVPALAVLRDRPAAAGAALARAYAGLLLGAVAASAPGLLVFAAAGAWDPFVDAVILHNLHYAQGNSVAAAAGLLRHRLAEQAPGLGVCWVLAASGLLFPKLIGRRSWALLGGWLLASAAGVSVGLYFRPHYFIQALPALAALCGAVLGAAGVRVLAWPRPALAALGLALLAAFATVPSLAATSAVRGAGTPAEISREIYGLNPFPESLEIGKYIRRTSSSDDRVYIVGSEPQILFYAGRASATRYIFFYPLTAGYPGVLERQRGVAAEVAAARPLYVVWSNIATSLLVDADSEPFLLGEAKAMLDREYRLEFVAHPVPGQASFEFVYGVEARKLMRSARERADEAPWIALYRRQERTRRAPGP